jgi:hypothetical protein
MSKAALQASLRLWQRRHKYRQRKLDLAHAHDDQAAIDKWHALLVKAGKMIARRKAQLTPDPPLRERAYTVACTLIGVMEQGGNNSGPMVSRIIRENGGTGPEPWCGDTMAFCYRHGGSKNVTRPWASVALLGNLLGVKRTAWPQRGDLVRFTFDHVGMFVRDLGDGQIETIEGNTGASGAMSDSATGGDGVYRKHRQKSLVYDYLRVAR